MFRVNKKRHSAAKEKKEKNKKSDTALHLKM